MSNHLKVIIRETVLELLEVSVSNQNINKLTEKHQAKIHFVPIRYRIIGGILQSLNIKFGNFIETLLGNILDIDNSVSKLPDSGKKIRLFFTPRTDALIDNYITGRQLPNSPDDCTPIFDKLLKDILVVERSASTSDRQGIVKDVDSLFETNEDLKVFAELKYNDDHDTGKFADINRKFLKTWAGLAVRLKISDPSELMPIIYYLNPTKRYGPIHTPSRNIMRGAEFFEQFLQTSYSDVDKYLSEIGDDPDILSIFDDMYDRVRNGGLNIKQKHWV